VPSPEGRVPSPWRVVAASVAGAGHERAGVPCQDAHHWALAAGGTLVAAVADGAGSASLGGLGAEVASRAAVRAAARALPAGPDAATLRATLGGALAVARAAVGAEAAARAAAPQDLATTLIVVAALPGGEAVAAMQVGDGAAVCADAGGRLHTLTSPRWGEYVNETAFLSTPGAVEAAQWGWWEPNGNAPDGAPSSGAARLAVLSDGLQMLALAMPAGDPHPPFFAPLLRYAAGAADPGTAAEGLAAFLRGPRVAARTDDDVTLLLAVREEECC